MTQRQMSIRIGLDGAADVKSGLTDIGATGDAAYSQLGTAIDGATSAMVRQKAAQDQLAQSQQNAANQKSSQNWFNQVMGVSPNSGAGDAQKSAASMTAAYAGMETRAAALRAQIDPLGAAQLKLNAAIADAGTLLAAGTITETEHAAAVTLAKKSYADAAVALTAYGVESGISVTKTRELSETFVHLAEGATRGGFSLRQMGMALGDMLRASSGAGGLGGAAEALGSVLINPFVLGAGAIGALVLGLTRAQAAELQFASASQLAGRAAGLTQTQFEGIAESAAKAGDISVNSARDIEAAFAKSGAVGQQMLIGLISLTKDYADKTGQDMDTARDALVKAFADPAKGGEQLLESVGALDDKTKQYLDTLVAQNRLTDAQTVLENKLTAALKGATDQTTWYGDAWKWVKDEASAAVEAMSHGFTSPALSAQLGALQSELANAKNGLGTGVSPLRSIADIQADIARVSGQIDALNQKAKQGASDAAATALSNAAGPIVRGAIPGYGDLQSLQNNKAVLDQLSGNTAAMSKLGASTADAASAQDAYNRAIATYLDPATKAAKLTQLELDSQSDLSPAQKQATAQKREAIELSGKVITAAQANAQIQEAGARAYADAARAVNKHTESLAANLAAQLGVADAYLKGSEAGEQAEETQQKLDDQIGKAAVNGAKQYAQISDETAARKLLNDQVAAGAITSEEATRQMATQTALAPLLVAQSLAEGAAKAELTKIIAKLTDARTKDNAEADRSKALAEVETGNRNVQLLQQELAISNDNDAARQVELAVLQKKQELLSQNIDAESDEGRAIIASTRYATFLNQQLDLAKASRGELESMFDTLGSDFSNFITQGQYDWKSFESVAVSALQSIAQEILKLGALDPLKNALFGTNDPTLGSVGGILGSLFGGGGFTPEDVVVTPSVFGTFHTGGMAGAANENRMLPASVLRFAPRFHSGVDLSADEVPAILQLGERVLNRQETKAYNSRAAGASGAMQITVDVSGARGSSEIEDAVNRGVQKAISASGAMLTAYDKNLARKVAPIAKKVQNDPRWTG